MDEDVQMPLFFLLSLGMDIYKFWNIFIFILYYRLQMHWGSQVWNHQILLLESISLKAMNGQVCQSMGRKHHPLFVCFIGLIVNSTLSGKHLNCLVILIVFKIFYLDKYVGLGVGGGCVCFGLWKEPYHVGKRYYNPHLKPSRLRIFYLYCTSRLTWGSVLYILQSALKTL